MRFRPFESWIIRHKKYPTIWCYQIFPTYEMADQELNEFCKDINEKILFNRKDFEIIKVITKRLVKYNKKTNGSSTKNIQS